MQIDSFHIILGLGALAALFFLVPSEQSVKRRQQAEDYAMQLPFGMESQHQIEDIDPSDYMVLPAYPYVRRGHFYGTDYMETKRQKNNYLANPTPEIHFIEPDNYRKSNIMELRDLDYIYDPVYPVP